MLRRCHPHSISKVAVLPPRPPEIPPHKAAHPEDPVRHHGGPHAHGSHAHPDAEHDAQPDAEGDHGEDCYRHGIFHVIASPEHVGQHKGSGPQQDRQAIVDHHKDIGQLRGLRPQAVEPQDWMQKQQNQTVGHRRGGICDQQQLFRIIPHLRQVPGPHALPYHGDHGQVHALPYDAAHAVQAVGHAVGGDLGRTEARDDAHHDYPAQLENAVLDAAGDPDIEDFPDDPPFEPEPLPVQMDGAVRIPQEDIQAQARHGPGHQRRHRHARHAHLQAEHAEGIATHVDDVHQHGHLQGNLGIPHGAEQRRAGIIDGQEREGQRGDDQVENGIAHHVLLYPSEKKVQDEPVPGYDQKGDHYGDQGIDPEELLRGAAGFLPLGGPDELAGDHRPAGGQGGQYADNQVIEHVH